MQREAFLARLRERLAVPAPANLAHPLPAAGEVPAVAYARPAGDDLVDEFLAAAAAHGAVARRVAGDEDLDDFAGALLQAHPAASAVVSRDAGLEAVTAVLESAGVAILPFDGPRPDADLGVTGAVAGIARTGTLVVSAAAAGGRTASLLPAVHLAVVSAGALVATPSDVWRSLPARFGGDLPSQVVFVTGPSKSADIEFQLTVGVHGPKAVWIAVVP